MPTGRTRPPLSLVPAPRSSPTPFPPSSISPVTVAEPSPGAAFAAMSGSRDIAVLQDREARQQLFRRCDGTNRGSICLEELLAGIAEECPELDYPRALRRAFVAANVSRNGLVPRREFRLMLEYAVFFRDASDVLDRLERLASPHDDGRLSFDEFVRSVHELLPDNVYNEAQLHLHFDFLDKDEQGRVRFVDVCSWAATEHVATQGGDAGKHGSPRVAYVWDGEPLSVSASANNWREAVRNHWMASVRLQHPERLPHALRVGREYAVAEAGAEAVRSRGAQPSATTDIDDSHRAEEDQWPAVTETASESTAVATDQGTDPPKVYGDAFAMPDKDRRRETFARMDRNNNGELSLEDYTAGLDALWPGLHGEHPVSVQRAFAAADTRRVGLLGTREFPRLLEYTLYFYGNRAEFDAIDQDCQGRVDESEFASICERTGVNLSDDEMRREFAALDRHDPDSGLYRSGYIQFEEYCCWVAKHNARKERKDREEARMLERSKLRQDRTRSRDPPGANVSGISGRESRTPEHHRNGHGSHSTAWERHKGMEGADTFYDIDRSRPGQDWAERRHGAAFRSKSARFTSHVSDTPPPGHYHKDTDAESRRRVNRSATASFSRGALRTDELELAPSSPLRKAAHDRKQGRSSAGSRSGSPTRTSPRTRRTWVDDHETRARDVSGTAPEDAAVTTDLHYRPQSEFDVDAATRRHEKGPFIGRADRFQDSPQTHLPGPGHYTAHEAWIPTSGAAVSAHSFGTPQYRNV